MLDMADHDCKKNEEIKIMMVNYISKLFGHNSWERMVELRWLRTRANIQSYHFDPEKQHIVAVTYDGPGGKKLGETAASDMTNKLL